MCWRHGLAGAKARRQQVGVDAGRHGGGNDHDMQPVEPDDDSTVQISSISHETNFAVIV